MGHCASPKHGFVCGCVVTDMEFLRNSKNAKKKLALKGCQDCRIIIKQKIEPGTGEMKT